MQPGRSWYLLLQHAQRGGQGDDELGALVIGVVGHHAPTMRFDHDAHHFQAQPQPRLAVGRLAPVVTIKNVRQVLFGDARAGVPNPDDDVVVPMAAVLATGVKL